MKDITNNYVPHIPPNASEENLDSTSNNPKKLAELEATKEILYIYQEAFLNDDAVSMKNKYHPLKDVSLQRHEVNISFIPPKDCSEVDFVHKEDSYFKWNIYGNLEISIYKPLVPLKVALFFWFTAALSMITYFSIFLSHRGITVKQISVMYMVVTVIQFLCVSALGVLADKIGRPKPLLILNILVTMFAALALVNVPSSIDPQPTYLLRCDISNSTQVWMENECSMRNSVNIELCKEINVDFTQQKCRQSQRSSINTSVDTTEEKVITILLNASQRHTDLCLHEKYSMNCSSYESLNNYFYSCGQDNTCDIICQKIKTSTLDSPSFKRTVLVVIYTSLSLVLLVSYTSVFRLFDIICVMLVKEHNAEFGKQRVFSIFGYLIGPMLSGFFVEHFSRKYGEKHFDAAMYVYVSMCVVTILTLVSTVKVSKHKPSKNMWGKAITFMKKPDILLFLLVVLVVGTNFGFCIIYKSLYLDKSLNFHAYQIGLIESAYNLYGLPFLYASKWWIKKIGNYNVFAVALIARAVHTFGYSFMTELWMAFLLEMTSCLSFHLFWVAVMQHCERISPEGLFSTVAIITGAVHFTMGRLSGSLIGRFVMSEFGGRFTFRVLGIMDVTAAITYGIYLWMKRKYAKRDAEILKGNTVHG